MIIRSSKSFLSFGSLDHQANLANLFRPITQANTNEPAAASGKNRHVDLLDQILLYSSIASAVLHTYHPQYQAQLNNFMVLNSQIHRSISPSDLSPPQRPRHRHHHHHRHSTTPRRTQPTSTPSNNEQQQQQTNEHHNNEI